MSRSFACTLLYLSLLLNQYEKFNKRIYVHEAQVYMYLHRYIFTYINKAIYYTFEHGGWALLHSTVLN
jgi:hypothetical protein